MNEKKGQSVDVDVHANMYRSVQADTGATLPDRDVPHTLIPDVTSRWQQATSASHRVPPGFRSSCITTLIRAPSGYVLSPPA